MSNVHKWLNELLNKWFGTVTQSNQIVLECISILIVCVGYFILPVIRSRFYSMPTEVLKELLEEVFFQILNLRDQYYGIFKDKRLDSKDFQALYVELIEIFEHHARIIPNYHIEKLKRIKDMLESTKSNKDKNLKRKYSSFFIAIEFDTELLRRKRGYLSNSLWRNLCLKTSSRFVAAFVTFCFLFSMTIWIFLVLISTLSYRWDFMAYILGIPFLVLSIVGITQRIKEYKKGTKKHTNTKQD